MPMNSPNDHDKIRDGALAQPHGATGAGGAEADEDWRLLHAPDAAGNPAAADGGDDKSLPKVILLGDSIRLGYQNHVRDALRGRARVLFPPENSRFAQYLLRFIGNWQNDGGWGNDASIVHWNAGLWDCLRVDGDGPMTPMPFYRDLLARIHRRLRMRFPSAKLVFATTTPIDESRCAHPELFERRNAEIEEINAAAREVLGPLGEDFDDLYKIMASAPPSDHSDLTHWNTPSGTRRIGDAVARCILRLL